jgi:hypothetical protein
MPVESSTKDIGAKAGLLGFDDGWLKVREEGEVVCGVGIVSQDLFVRIQSLDRQLHLSQYCKLDSLGSSCL